MNTKAETYKILRSTNTDRIIDDINRILSMLENRLDIIEGLRYGYFTTQVWEREFIKGGG